MVWVRSSSRSASVLFPWSMCATMLKLRMRSGGITRRSLVEGPGLGLRGRGPRVRSARDVGRRLLRGWFGGRRSRPDRDDPGDRGVVAEVVVLVQQRAVRCVHEAAAADVVALVRGLDAAAAPGRHARIDNRRVARAPVVA